MKDVAVLREADPFKAPRVTVVTPTFDRAHLIRETISSVLSQTLDDFEYLVVDDGSKDATQQVVAAFGDPRICYLRHENRGEAATTNRGWAMARGDYFAVLSSDDLVRPRWLEQVVGFMDRNPEVVVAYPDFDVIDLASQPVRHVAGLDYDRSRMITSFHPFPGVGAVIRRAGLTGMPTLRNPGYRFAPDLDCWFRLSLLGPFARVPEVLGSWRDHPGSITVADRNVTRATEMVAIARNFFATPGLPPDVASLAPYTLAQAHVMAAWVVQNTHPLRRALHLRRSYKASLTLYHDVLPYIVRTSRPTGRDLLRLLWASLHFRSRHAVEDLGRRMPAPVRALGRVLPRFAQVRPSPAPSTTPESATATDQPPLASTPPEPPPVPAPAPPPTPAEIAQQRFDALLPHLREDMAALSATVSPLSPTTAMLDVLRSRARATTLPLLGALTASILERLPSRIDHMLVVPWIGTIGGSETVTSRLVEALRRHYSRETFCIVAPDASYPSSGVDSYLGVPVLNLSDVDPSLDLAARVEVLDRILIHRRPRVLHSVNSYTAWRAIRERGPAYAHDTALFANIYSDMRLEDGAPAAAYYYDFLPHCIESLSGVLVDNHTVARKAAVSFGIGTGPGSKLHIVRTPVLGLQGGDPRAELRPFSASPKRRSLWLSRIAKEKRLDVVASLARRLPGRAFELYGSNNGVDVELGGLLAAPNVRIVGRYGSLEEIPYDRFDSYVFTSSSEGMPISLLEVAAKGLPLVAPDIGGIGELVSEETGWLISRADAVGEYADALAQIGSDPAEARRRVDAVQAILLREHTRDAFDRALRAIPHYLGGYA